MASTWTITRAGETRSLTDWGIASIRLTRRSLEVDDLVFSLKPADGLAAPSFVFDDVITLAQDGVTRFVGRIGGETIDAADSKEQLSFLAKNLWDDLETLVYEQNRKIVDEDFANPAPIPTTQVVLFRQEDYSEDGWHHVTSLGQIASCLAFAAARGVGLTPALDFTGVQPPWSEARDLSVAAAIRRAAAWTPDLATYIDYTTIPPTVHVVRRATMSTHELDLTAGTQVLELSGLRARKDLVPLGVVFIYLTSAVNPIDGLAYTRVSTSGAGVTSGARVIKATVDLTNLENNTTPMTGGALHLAGAYFASLQQVFFDGSITLKAFDCPGGLHPGMKVNLLNGRADWATAEAIIQEISEDLLLGVTTIIFGLPSPLSGADFVALRTVAKNARKDYPGAPGSAGGSTGTDGGSAGAPGTPGGSNPGGSAETGQQQPDGGYNQQPLELCGGQVITVLTP
ncbi:MAG: hypothetical protein PHE83_05910 [Opitutaceae bacterium]|nr:hypothetical protein [Opitutaceae bacterium]